MSSRRRMPQNVGMSPTALYGSIIERPLIVRLQTVCRR
jgi:hypothetical protein